MVLVGVVALVAISSWLLHNQMIARWALAIDLHRYRDRIR